MSLIDAMMEACVFMNEATVDDGEGGHITQWSEGAHINVAIVNDTSLNAKIAEKEGITSTYTLTTRKEDALKPYQVIKRLSDGQIFRITSDSREKTSPIVSTLDIAQCSAEKWSLPS